MGKKGQKKKFTPLAEHDKKNEANKINSPDRGYYTPSYSGNTNSPSSSGWSTRTHNTSREETGSWRTDNSDLPPQRKENDWSRRDNFSRNQSTDFSYRKDSSWGRRDTTSRYQGTAGIRNEELNNSITENSEHEMPASDSSIPSFDHSSSDPIDLEVSNLSVEDTGVVNSSRTGSNIAYNKPTNATEQGGVWRSSRNWSSEGMRTSDGTRPSERQNGRNQRQKTENYDENIERNWRIRDNTARNSDDYKDRGWTSRTDAHQTTEDRPKTFESERRSFSNRDSPKEGTKASPGSFYRKRVFYETSDEEKAKFVSYLESREADSFIKVQEEEKDLFSVEKDYALAHCVAEDMNMGSGIAVEFRNRYKKVHELLNQYAKTGGLASLKIGDQFIYYLVTKAISQGKPSYDTLWSSLIELRTHMRTNGVKKLALPRIGCGLDRLDWAIVKPMLDFVFRDEDFDILVCNLQVEGSNNSHGKKCKIVYETKSITEIESQTIIIYFASKDGEPTDTMTSLDKKFFFASQFQRAPKNIGEAIRLVPTNVKNYILYGCIVKNKADDPFDFIAFDKCLRTIKKNYKTDNLYYVAFQKPHEEGLNAKILNLMKNSLIDIEIYVCGCSESLSNLEE